MLLRWHAFGGGDAGVPKRRQCSELPSRSGKEETTMLGKRLPARVFSSSACHLRCLAVLTAAWGSHGFRATHRHLVSSTSDATTSTSPSSSWRGKLGGGAGGDAYRRGAVAGFSLYGHRRRHFSSGGAGAQLGFASTDATATGAQLGCASADATEAGDAAASAAAAASFSGAATTTTGVVEVEERKWLGNGPDPMANTGKILPGTNASVAAVQGANGAEKGNGVPTEELWLNGPFKAPLPPGPLDIIYVDDDIVVANKPSNLLCVPGRAEKDSLATRAALELGHYRVDRMVVHRLDMATSGCIIMARTDAALKDLHRQFRERQVRKRYVAMVHGVLLADEGEVDLPLCRNTGCPPLHMVNHEHGKPSLSTWRVLERAPDRTRVELIPVSGRSHQLRLHMDAIGHPILGDHFYGTKESLALADRCLLHAHTLCLRHPTTGKGILFTAPCEF